MTEDKKNPREKGSQPPFPKQEQQNPGKESKLEPKPDHGEESYRGSGKLEGKAALVTGGDSGIGRAVALAFAREGADVLIAHLSEEQDAQETVRLVESAGRKGVAVAGDIRDETHCQHLIQRALEAFGRLDILVNNAAYSNTHDSITDLSSEEFEETFRVNMFAMFNLCKAAVPHMKSGASIINTTSVQGYQPSPSLLAYASTKGAVTNFTKALAQDLIRREIRVNAVAPGPVWTPLIPASMPAEQVSSFGKGNPMGRPAQPAELAPAYVFLASPESSYVAGEILGVTGGAPMP